MQIRKIVSDEVSSLKDFAILAYSIQHLHTFYKPGLQIDNSNPTNYGEATQPSDIRLTSDEEVLTLMADIGDIYAYVLRMKYVLYHGIASSVMITGDLKKDAPSQISIMYRNSSEGDIKLQYNATEVTEQDLDIAIEKMFNNYRECIKCFEVFT